MGLFGTVLPKICPLYPAIMKLGTVIPYLKKIQKIYESHDAPLDFCWHQFFFFTKDQKILLHQEIQIQIANWYLNSICFNLFWICKNFFNKHDCNFDDVSKNGFSWTFYRQDFEKKHVKDTKMSLKGKKRKCEKRSETNMKISVKKKQKLREYMKKYYLAHKK